MNFQAVCLGFERQTHRYRNIAFIQGRIADLQYSSLQSLNCIVCLVLANSDNSD